MRTRLAQYRRDVRTMASLGGLMLGVLMSLVPIAPFAADGGSDSDLNSVVSALGTPKSFDAVFAELQSLPRIKDEFETAATYEERRNVALGAVAPQYLIEAPVDMEYVRYNADTKSLVVATYALSNTLTSSDEINCLFGYGSELKKYGINVAYSSLGSNIAWALPCVRKDVGVYTGRNAFGATIEVTKQEETSRCVFEREGPYDCDLWNAKTPPYVENVPPVAFAIAVEPAAAKQLKEKGLRAAFLVIPAAPYYASGTTVFSPTLRTPVELVTKVQCIIGDIRCAALFNADGDLLAVRETQ